MSGKQDSTVVKRPDEGKEIKLTATIDTKRGTLELDINSLRKSRKAQEQILAAEQLFDND